MLKGVWNNRPDLLDRMTTWAPLPSDEPAEENSV